MATEPHKLLPGPEWALAAFLAFVFPGQLAWLWLLQSGIVEPPAVGEPLGPEHVEWGLVCQAINCLCVLVLTRFASPGIGIGRIGTGRALLWYLGFLLLWVPVCLVLYLQVMREAHG